MMNRSMDKLDSHKVNRRDKMNELEESKLRSKVMLLLFHHRKPTRIKRIINKFIKCVDSHSESMDSNDESKRSKSMDSQDSHSESNGNGQV